MGFLNILEFPIKKFVFIKMNIWVRYDLDMKCVVCCNKCVLCVCVCV